MERREVHYCGWVQGVGFRYQARDIAAGLAVTGFVQNLFDGRVQLVAEGEPAELDRLLAGISAAMRRNIEGQQVTKAAATGEFEGFTVRH